MKVIMLKDVKGVGQRHTVQEVSDGYGFNYLIANGLAEQATTRKILALEQYKQSQSAASAEKGREWASLAKHIASTTISVSARANASGHLYEQLSPETIAAALRTHLQVDIPADAIMLNAPIKQVGESEVALRLGTSMAKFTINVIAAQ